MSVRTGDVAHILTGASGRGVGSQLGVSSRTPAGHTHSMTSKPPSKQML